MIKAYTSYFLKILIKNKLMWAFVIFNLLAIILVEVLVVGSTNIYNNIFDNSLIVLGVPNILLLLSSSYCCVVLFLNTRNNNIDLHLYISSLTKVKLVLIKQLTIFMFLLHILLFEVVILFVRLSISDSKDNIAFLGLITFFSLILMSLIWIAIFSYLGTVFNYLFSFLSIFIISIGLTIAAIIPTALKSHGSPKQTYDVNNKSNVIRALNVDDNGFLIEEHNFIYQNATQSKTNSVLTPRKAETQSYLPFEAILGFTPIVSNVVFTNMNAKSKYGTDLWWSSIDISNSSNFSNSLLSYKNTVFATSEFKTIYQYKDKIELYNDIYSEIENDQATRDLMANYVETKSIFNDLNTSDVWVLNDKYKSIITHLLGLTNEKSLLYEIFDNKDLILKKFPDIIDFIKTKANDDFSNLFKLLLFDQKTKNNLLAYQNIVSTDKVKEFHPIIKTFDDNAQANNYDIEYVKNKLFFLVTNDSGNISSIRYLKNNNLYENMTSYETIFTNVKTRSDWESYINRNSNLANLKNLVDTVKTQIPDLKSVVFNENAYDGLVINQILNYEYYTKNNQSWIYVLALIAVASITEVLLAIKVSRKDLI